MLSRSTDKIMFFVGNKHTSLVFQLGSEPGGLHYKTLRIRNLR
jgi:hypothetical protein